MTGWSNVVRYERTEPIGSIGNSYCLGIDIGTTFTSAAVCRGDGPPRMADLASHGPVAPSVLLLRDDGELLCGDAAHRRAAGEPQRVVREFKRRVGDPTPIIVDRTPFAADALMATLLAWVADTVGKAEGGPPAGVAVTHPANWGDYKLDLLRQAIRGANLGNASLVSEPEAAAIHYATQERIEPGAVVAVYDLGGGTFDAAVLRRTASSPGPSGSSSAGPSGSSSGGHSGSQWHRLGQPEGIERLGGIDVDEAVFRYVVEITGIADQLDADDPTLHSALHRLRQDCTAAKEALSADTDVSIPVLLPGSTTPGTFSQVRLTRSELEEMVGPTLRATIGALQRTMGSAGLQAEDVHSVLLAGGSSRIPLVSQLLTTELRRPLAVDAHPKHSVALGAALVAAHRQSGGPDTVETVRTDVEEPRPSQVNVAASPAVAPAFVVPIAPAVASSERPGAVALADPPEDPSDARPKTHRSSPDAATETDNADVYLTTADTGDDDTPTDGRPTSEPVSRSGVLVATGALVLLAVVGILLFRSAPSNDADGSATPSRSPAPAAAPNVTGDRSTTPGSEADHLLDQQHEDDNDGTTESTGAGPGGGGGTSSGSAPNDGRDGTQANNSTPGGQSGPGTTSVETSQPTTSTTARQPTVPSVVGKEVPAAEAELQAAGFEAVYDACPTSEPCVVTAQDPGGGTRAPAGSRVHLTIGSAS